MAEAAPVAGASLPANAAAASAPSPFFDDALGAHDAAAEALDGILNAVVAHVHEAQLKATEASFVMHTLLTRLAAAVEAHFSIMDPGLQAELHNDTRVPDYIIRECHSEIECHQGDWELEEEPEPAPLDSWARAAVPTRRPGVAKPIAPRAAPRSPTSQRAAALAEADAAAAAAAAAEEAAAAAEEAAALDLRASRASAGVLSATGSASSVPMRAGKGKRPSSVAHTPLPGYEHLLPASARPRGGPGTGGFTRPPTAVPEGGSVPPGSASLSAGAPASRLPTPRTLESRSGSKAFLAARPWLLQGENADALLTPEQKARKDAVKAHELLKTLAGRRVTLDDRGHPVLVAPLHPRKLPASAPVMGVAVAVAVVLDPASNQPLSGRGGDDFVEGGAGGMSAGGRRSFSPPRIGSARDTLRAAHASASVVLTPSGSASSTFFGGSAIGGGSASGRGGSASRSARSLAGASSAGAGRGGGGGDGAAGLPSASAALAATALARVTGSVALDHLQPVVAPQRRHRKVIEEQSVGGGGSSAVSAGSSSAAAAAATATSLLPGAAAGFGATLARTVPELGTGSVTTPGSVSTAAASHSASTVTMLRLPVGAGGGVGSSSSGTAFHRPVPGVQPPLTALLDAGAITPGVTITQGGVTLASPGPAASAPSPGGKAQQQQQRVPIVRAAPARAARAPVADDVEGGNYYSSGVSDGEGGWEDAAAAPAPAAAQQSASSAAPLPLPSASPYPGSSRDAFPLTGAPRPALPREPAAATVTAAAAKAAAAAAPLGVSGGLAGRMGAKRAGRASDVPARAAAVANGGKRRSSRSPSPSYAATGMTGTAADPLAPRPALAPATTPAGPAFKALSALTAVGATRDTTLSLPTHVPVGGPLTAGRLRARASSPTLTSSTPGTSVPASPRAASPVAVAAAALAPAPPRASMPLPTRDARLQAPAARGTSGARVVGTAAPPALAPPRAAPALRQFV